jgi:hypothetical protein
VKEPVLICNELDTNVGLFATLGKSTYDAVNVVVAYDAVIALLILPVIGTDEVMEVPASISELAPIVLVVAQTVNLPTVPVPDTPPPVAPAVNA